MKKKFEIIGKYNRQFYQCEIWIIFMQHIFKIKNIYKKSYLDLTYKDISGISKRFEQITKLPKEKSDNK